MMVINWVGDLIYPRNLQQKIDEAIDTIHMPIYAGMYRTGFASAQQFKEMW